ncbi:hypothetical protein EC973_007186 [Apophysomyces ossiformis]|uniref:glucan endo-1,3-beta-D-glucosidase n=1 Tax=Apophysomyces ossiformis TaxID=679940 RepID=A0A8H7ER52_9FUNG|nr:hypothetical protein EC973_007186 [Apophysomyces ossiformis]
MFDPTSEDLLPDTFERVLHPYPPIFADPHFDTVVPTNAWISNLFYPSMNGMAPTTPDPYILRVLDGHNGSPGLSITQPSKKVYGSYPAQNNIPFVEAAFAINGAVVDIRVSATEWSKQSPKQQITYWDHLAATLKLSLNDNETIHFPIVRGMPYVTSIYANLTPHFYTQHAIIRVEADKTDDDHYTGFKFKIAFNDSPTSTYLIYALGSKPLKFHKVDNSNLIAVEKYNGPIRIAKLPSDKDEDLLDDKKDVWATGGYVTTNINDNSSDAEYTIRWHTAGNTTYSDLLTYAYPHHIQSLSQDIERTSLSLESATKGPMLAVLGDTWAFQEDNLSSAGWLPMNPAPELSTRNEIMGELERDVGMNYEAATNKSDNYFSGKGLQKLAMLALILNKPEQTELRNPELAKTSLDKLKDVFSIFLENRQQDPFFYDKVYRGIVARDGLTPDLGGTGDANAEFGHSYYSDHHYHQGYLIVTASVIHHLDPYWRTQDIKRFAEILIRDVNNPVQNDPYFAQFRNWDWFAGHSWAGGIKINGALDGRDQESSVNFYWGVKLWALATDDVALYKLASLQLAITKRTTYEYFWMLDSNKNRPVSMTTYFGRYLEFIHGIQQLPMTPALADDIRIPQFVSEEWEQKLAAIAPTLQTPWAGVLYLNYALVNPAEAYPKLRKVEMDDGQTRSYSLYLAATRPNFYRQSLSRVLAKHRGKFRLLDLKERVFRGIKQWKGLSSGHDARYQGY